ncbi:hypothetical protein DdX_06213 [Ditylenchus destructor]|uniref:Uncharacterized protein n=1 Tax=Ditylenchus destructor TaxID=166010 RepID=A0AAD4N5T0_9BILA|nr:hypothetical protein DdX_06213 [Ditylenchus destructor]
MNMGSNISNPKPTDEFCDSKSRQISSDVSQMFNDTGKILLTRLDQTEKSAEIYSSTERSEICVLSRLCKAKKKCFVGKAGLTSLGCNKCKCLQKCEKCCVQLRKWPKASLKCDKSRNSTFWTNSEMESSSTFFQTSPIMEKTNQEILQERIMFAPAKRSVTAVNDSTNYMDVRDGLKTSISALYPSVPPPEYSQISPKLTNRNPAITSLWPDKSVATTQNIDDFAMNVRFDPCGIGDHQFQLDMGGSSEDCQMTFDRGEKKTREKPHNTDSSLSDQHNKHQHFVIPSEVPQNLQIYSTASTPTTEIPNLTVFSSDSLQKSIGVILESESSSMRRSTNAKSHPNLQHYGSSKSKKRHISTNSKPHSKENQPVGFIVPPVFPHSCSLFDTAFHGGVYPQNSKEDSILLGAVEKARKRWESLEFVTGELTSRKEEELSTNCIRNPEETSWDSGRSSLSGHEEESTTLQTAPKDVETSVHKQSVTRDSCLGSPDFCSDPQSTISSKSEEPANQEHLEDDVFEKPGEISVNSKNNAVNRRRSMSTPIDPRLSKSDARKQRTSWKQKVLRTFSAGSVGKTKGRKDSKKGNRKGQFEILSENP